MRSSTRRGGEVKVAESIAVLGKDARSGGDGGSLLAARETMRMASGATTTELTAGRGIGGNAPRPDSLCTTSASPAGSFAASASMRCSSSAAMASSAGALITTAPPATIV